MALLFPGEYSAKKKISEIGPVVSEKNSSTRFTTGYAIRQASQRSKPVVTTLAAYAARTKKDSSAVLAGTFLSALPPSLPTRWVLTPQLTSLWCPSSVYLQCGHRVFHSVQLFVWRGERTLIWENTRRRIERVFCQTNIAIQQGKLELDRGGLERLVGPTHKKEPFL